MTLINNVSKKGFTLVELLIVIAIVAILATATIVVLNPAELLAQARDAQRIADLDNLRTALGLYVVSVATTDMCASTTPADRGCLAGGVCTFAPTAGNFPFGPVGTPVACASVSTRTIGITGWVDVPFAAIPGGSPLGILPIDPTNNATYFYAYRAEDTGKTFRLASRLESTRYRPMMLNDGGPRSTCATFIEPACFYEIGTNLIADF